MMQITALCSFYLCCCCICQLFQLLCWLFRSHPVKFFLVCHC